MVVLGRGAFSYELGTPVKAKPETRMQRMYDYAGSAPDRGIKVIIAGAGGAAHLPGMVAAMTPVNPQP